MPDLASCSHVNHHHNNNDHHPLPAVPTLHLWRTFARQGSGSGRKNGPGATRGQGPPASLDGPGPQMYPCMIQGSYGSNNDGMF